MKFHRILMGVVLIGSLAFANASVADTVIVTRAPQPSTKVVVAPKPVGPVQATVRALTKPDCDTTIKKTEGPVKTTTTVKKDCD